MCNHILIQLGCKDKKKKTKTTMFPLNVIDYLTPGPNLVHPVFIWPQAMLVFHIFNNYDNITKFIGLLGIWIRYCFKKITCMKKYHINIVLTVFVFFKKLCSLENKVM